MEWIIGSFISFIIGLIIYGLYIRHKSVKDYERWKREHNHHYSLPYEPD